MSSVYEQPASGKSDHSKEDRINFWELFNTAAAALQEAAHSETAVYQAFREQMIRLGLQGSISWLEESGARLNISVVFFSGRMLRVLRRIERLTGQTAEGFQFPIAYIPALSAAVTAGEAVFLPDNRHVLAAISAERVRPFMHQLMDAFAGLTGILAPLTFDGQVHGLLYLAHPQMTEKDSTTVTALANHLAIAIQNARLFQRLSESEARLRILAENVPGVIYQCINNYSFDMIYLNNAIETLTGYPKEMFLRGEIGFRDLYHPDDSPVIRPEQEDAVKDMGMFHLIYRIRHRSGAWRWVEEFGSGVFNEQGELLFLEGSITDITERKQAEVLHSTLYRIATVANADLTLVQLYGAIHAILGDLMDVRNFYIALVEEETGWLHLPYFVDEVDVYDGLPFAGEDGLTDYVIQTGRPQLLSRIDLKRLARADIVHVIGTEPEVWLGAPLRTQAKVFGAMVVQSYTDALAYTEREKQLLFFVSGQVAAAIERKRAEEELRQMAAEIAKQARMFEVVLSTTPDQFVVYDRDGRITFASPVFLRALGRPATEVLGKTMADLAVLPLDISRRSDADRQQVFQTGKPRRGEVQIPGPHSLREVEYILSPIVDDAGVVAAVVSAARDVTERNKTKAALHHAQKMESLGVLAGGVAHDFNNLLVGMMAQSSLALAKLPENHPAAPHIEKAAKATEKAAALTRQLLAYSGQGHFTIQPLDLNTLIHDYFSVLRVTVTAAIDLRFQPAPSLPLIEGDPGQMQQIVLNLVLNSSEAIGDRAGVITLATGVRTISEKDESYWQMTNAPLGAGDYVYLSVHDDGEGMDAPILFRIFEPFFTTRFTGRGLGLAAVLGIVRGHEGGLRVASSPENGATFEIIFPISETAAVTAVAPATTTTAGVVLVIDDEDPVREAVTEILEMEGIQVLAAASGQDGLALYQQRRSEIGLVILDLSLPDMRGEAIFARLREINPAVCVVFSSGYSASEITLAAGDGPAAFLQKPYSLADLTRVVRQNLSR